MLKHGRIGMTRPEQFPKSFNVYEKDSEVSARGRVGKTSDPKLKGVLRCILSVAKPEERETFHQMGVNVTHDLIQRGGPIAKEQDILALVKRGKETRWFRVQAIHNKGEMDIDTIYYCEERGDLNGL